MFKTLQNWGKFQKKTTLKQPSLIRVKSHGFYTSLLQRNFISLSLKKTFSLNLLLKSDFKGAAKSYFTHYSFVVFILFNTGLCKSAFSTNSFRKLFFLSFCAFCLFCLLCVEFDVIFINFVTFSQSLFILVSRNLCFCSHLWETVC